MSLFQQILDRLQQQEQRTREMRLIGPAEALVNALPQNWQTPVRAAEYYPLGFLPDLLDLGLDASGEVAKALTGATIMAGANFAPAGSGLRTAADAALYNEDGTPERDLFEAFRRANENVAAGHPLLTGAANLALDPTNAIGPAMRAAGLTSKAPMLATPGRALAERLDDVVAGAKTGVGALKLAHKAGAEAQGIAQAGGQTVSTVYKKGPKAGQTRQAWQNLRQRLDLPTAWANAKQQMVLKPRNLEQDFANNSLWAREAGIPQEEVNHAIEGIVGNAQTAGGRVQDALPNRMGRLLQDFGLRTGFDPQTQLGMGFLDAQAGSAEKFLSPFVSAALEGGYALANPLRGGVPVLGAALAAGKGYFRAYQNAAFSALSHIIQGGFRSVAWEVGFGDELAKVAPGYLNSLPKHYADQLRTLSEARWNQLAGLGENMAMYDKHALFTPDDVLQTVVQKLGPGRAYGQQRAAAAAKQWAGEVEKASAAGSVTAKKTFMDFSDAPTDPQRYLDYAVPFLGWARRAYPKTIEIAANHPVASNLLLHVMRADAEEAEREGRPSWQVGTIPFDTETPVAGGLLNVLANGPVEALSGRGQRAEGRLDLFSLLTPLPGSTIGGASDLEDARTPADALRAVLDTAGAGLSPMLEAALYAGGLTDKKPRSISATAGLEQAMPGPELPSVAHGPLTAIRKAQDKSGPGDPVESAAKELVYARTGLPVSDPSNKQYALEIQRHEGVYKEAEAQYEGGAGAKSLLGYVNPVNLSTQTEAGAAARTALAQRPVPPAEMQRLREKDPAQATVAYYANEAYKRANPAAAVYDNAKLTSAEKRDPRLLAWESQHDNLKYWAPTLYAQMRQDFIRANGIRD